MKSSDLESIKKTEDQINGMRLIIGLNKTLNAFGLGKKDISSMEKSLDGLENQLKDMKEIPQKFNDIFSSRGWIAYESMNFNLMKDAIEVFKKSGIEEAEKLILNHYSPQNIDYDIIRLKAVPEILRRYKFIEFAYSDYKDEKYYSVIPLLLMIIDGSVNDFKNKGFHSDKVDLFVWDSISYIDNGIEIIRNIFRTGRNKTRDEIIDLPYRNGILHGMDLGYDNYNVAAKCWHFLFVIRDWILAKKSEPDRKNKFIEENQPTSLSDTIESIRRTEKLKLAIQDWKPREITEKYIQCLNKDGCIDNSQPEVIALKFLYLPNKNYGHLADLFWPNFYSNPKNKLIQIKDQFIGIDIDTYRIINIKDEAPAISEIDIFINEKNNTSSTYTMRLIYQGDNKASSRNLKDGKWEIVHVLKSN